MKMAADHSRLGFSLIEMLVVTTMIGLLMTVSVLSASKARTLARRTKAETEMREMISAWLQYQATYDAWPDRAKGKIDISVDEPLLGPIIDPGNTDNPLGIAFFSLVLKKGAPFRDPWGTAYRISFDKEALKIRRKTVLETSVFLKFAQE